MSPTARYERLRRAIAGVSISFTALCQAAPDGGQAGDHLLVTTDDPASVSKYFTGSYAIGKTKEWVRVERAKKNGATVLDPRSYRSWITGTGDGGFVFRAGALEPGGRYLVRFHFVEPQFTKASERVFSIEVNGEPVIEGLDIASALKRPFLAHVEEVIAKADGRGKIRVGFINGDAGNPVVSAIEVLPRPLPSDRASRINLAGYSTGSWDPDRSGRINKRSRFPRKVDVGTEGAAPDLVYESVRFGNSRWAMGGYEPEETLKVRLHFAELFFDEPGMRVFGVSINGKRLLDRFDIVGEAGGPRKAVVKEFFVAANRNGEVVVSLFSLVKDATIAGIEVLP